MLGMVECTEGRAIDDGEVTAVIEAGVESWDFGKPGSLITAPPR